MYRDKAKESEMRKRNYYKRLEENRERNRKNKANQLLRRRDQINAYQRGWYARDAASEAAKQNARRIRRLPYIGIRAAIRDCQRGTLDVNELTKLIRERFAPCFGVNATAGRFRPGRRGIHSPGNATDLKEPLRHRSNQNSSNQVNVSDSKR
jgi:hypothetical protein